MRSDCSEAAFASYCMSRVNHWVSSVSATMISPPTMPSQPSQGWNRKMAPMNRPTQGRSNNASSAGEARSFCTDSRSLCAAAAPRSFGVVAERFSAAAKTRRSSPA